MVLVFSSKVYQGNILSPTATDLGMHYSLHEKPIKYLTKWLLL